MIFENEDIMAAAEARAAWQRAANRCLVQEDAKRAPKLACCPSSSVQQNESNNTDPTTGQDQCASSFMPLSWNFMNSNLPSDTKWWLQMQPNFGYKKDFIYEQLKGLSNEHLDAEETINQSSFADEEIHGGFTESEDKKDSPMDSSCMVSATSMNLDSETRIQEMKELTNTFSQKTLKYKADIRECYFKKELLDMKPIDRISSQKTEMAKLDLEAPWDRSNKCEPWWRVSDKEELASFVAQKSLENIENCDLPRPAHMCRNPFACLESWEGNKIFSSSLGCNLDAGMCPTIDFPEQSSAVKDMDEKYLHSNRPPPPPFATEKWDSEARSSNIAAVIASESQLDSGSDPSRTKLLEALCLSQTRARKAEIAAQKAYDEKEHIVKLLFKQASYLFAYKQWLQILQLESLFLQLRIKDHQISSVLPILPWMPLRNKPVAKGRCEGRRGKKQKKCRLCKYALLFAVGLGLAGAGLFLGGCFGWFSPNL